MNILSSFTPRIAWPEYYMEDTIPAFMSPLVVQSATSRGVRYGFWPLYIEVYVGNHIPDISFSRSYGTQRTRIAMWHSYVPTLPIPSGWHHLSNHTESLIGYATIPPEGPYHLQWSKRTREYRNAWLHRYHNKTHHIENISIIEFETVYRKTAAFRIAGSLLLRDIKNRIEAKSTPVELVVVRNTHTNKIVAGGAFEYSASCKSVYYITGFHISEETPAPCMIGLFDEMFQRAQSKGMCYVDFGLFWKKGEPRSWKGFSAFKSKFGTHYFESPPIRIKFIPGTCLKLCILLGHSCITHLRNLFQK